MVEQRIGDVRVLGRSSQRRSCSPTGRAQPDPVATVDTIDMKMVDRAAGAWKSGSTSTTARSSPTSTHRSAASVPGSTTRWGRCPSASSISKHKLIEAGERMDRWPATSPRSTKTAINAVKEQLSSAVGEAMLVRIEVDRFMAAQDEKFDATALRMSEIEAQLADSMDVGEAVQLERLEEIERALLELDPEPVRPQGRSTIRRRVLVTGPTSHAACRSSERHLIGAQLLVVLTSAGNAPIWRETGTMALFTKKIEPTAGSGVLAAAAAGRRRGRHAGESAGRSACGSASCWSTASQPRRRQPGDRAVGRERRPAAVRRHRARPLRCRPRRADEGHRRGHRGRRARLQGDLADRRTPRSCSTRRSSAPTA